MKAALHELGKHQFRDQRDSAPKGLIGKIQSNGRRIWNSLGEPATASPERIGLLDGGVCTLELLENVNFVLARSIGWQTGESEDHERSTCSGAARALAEIWQAVSIPIANLKGELVSNDI